MTPGEAPAARSIDSTMYVVVVFPFVPVTARSDNASAAPNRLAAMRASARRAFGTSTTIPMKAASARRSTGNPGRRFPNPPATTPLGKAQLRARGMVTLEDDGGGAPRDGVGDEASSVGFGPRYGDEQISCLNPARIVPHLGDGGGFRRPLTSAPQARALDALQQQSQRRRASGFRHGRRPNATRQITPRGAGPGAGR